MATSSEVPGRFPVAIQGRPYAIDPTGFRRETVDTIRQQADTSEEPGEASLNPKGLWRRSRDGWHHGAGQPVVDGTRSETDNDRYDVSYGIDVFSTRNQFTCLPGIVQIYSSTAANLKMIATGNRIYLTDGTVVYFASNPTSTTVPGWTSADIHAGQVAQTPTSLDTDGYHVWVALGTSGLHRTVRGATSSTADVPAAPAGGNIGVVGYALGRLLVAGSATSTTQRNVVWEVTNPLSTPTLSPAAAPYLMTHPDPNFVVTGIRAGRNCIYVFGNVLADILDLTYNLDYGGTGEVYRVGMNPTDTSLSAPSAATYLPDGESIHDVRFYAGGIILATSRGVRLGQADSAGNIDYGPLIETTSPVVALEPQGRYCWFGHTRYTPVTGVTYSGLARLDLGYFTDALTPAWAPDIGSGWVNNGLVTSAVSLAGLPGYDPVGNLCFAVNGGVGVSGSGYYRVAQSGTSTTKTNGKLYPGKIRFSTTEKKQLIYFDLRFKPLPAGCSIAPLFRFDGGTWWNFGSLSTTGATRYLIDLRSTIVGLGYTYFTFETMEIEIGLNASGANAPEILSWTVRALPQPVKNEEFTLPLLLKSTVATLAGDGQPHALDIRDEVVFLKDLEQNSRVIEFQVGEETFTGTLDVSSFNGSHWSDTPEREIEGTLLVKLSTLNA